MITNKLKLNKMINLRTQIENAQTSEELEMIVNAIPRQENGHQTSLCRLLNNAFWYNFKTVQEQKEFMLKRIK